MGFPLWIGDVWTWFTSPSVIPWAGVLAAIVAALTVAPRAWLTSPREFVTRALLVATVWLVVAWLLSSAARLGTGRGSGEGEADGSGTDMAGTTPPTSPGAGQFPAGMPEHVDLVVSFVPSAVNASSAQDFSCDLHVRGVAANPAKIEIRAKDMQEFEMLLIQQLRHGNPPRARHRLTILIRRSPFPGESVLRQIGSKVKTALPGATVMFDE